jgi:hypothetical protein
MEIDETHVYEWLQQLKIVSWMVTKEKTLYKIKFCTLENPQFVKVNVTLFD